MDHQQGPAPFQTERAALAARSVSPLSRSAALEWLRHRRGPLWILADVAAFSLTLLWLPTLLRSVPEQAITVWGVDQSGRLGLTLAYVAIWSTLLLLAGLARRPVAGIVSPIIRWTPLIVELADGSSVELPGNRATFACWGSNSLRIAIRQLPWGEVDSLQYWPAANRSTKRKLTSVMLQSVAILIGMAGLIFIIEPMLIVGASFLALALRDLVRVCRSIGIVRRTLIDPDRLIVAGPVRSTTFCMRDLTVVVVSAAREPLQRIVFYAGTTQLHTTYFHPDGLHDLLSRMAVRQATGL